ncbi:hypothetical protein IFM89_023712 [Coptis chinensis]|uniref:DUF632 domain-containing protein n=1 Tax=Coptis chinensis TaxID=261450 RepID=A0A835HF65_9MAGN|nr:hypothetical protein IFM89_023712 [Coptis chinensis]
MLDCRLILLNPGGGGGDSGKLTVVDLLWKENTASGRNVILLLDINRYGDSLYQKNCVDDAEDEREFTYVQGSHNGPKKWGEIHPEWAAWKRCKSSKVLVALSWSWSSRALHSSKDVIDFNESGEPSKPGAYGVTLDKIYAEEEKLYKEVKVLAILRNRLKIKAEKHIRFKNRMQGNNVHPNKRWQNLDCLSSYRRTQSSTCNSDQKTQAEVFKEDTGRARTCASEHAVSWNQNKSYDAIHGN